MARHSPIYHSPALAALGRQATLPAEWWMRAAIPLAKVRLACYNDWHRYPVVGSRGGGEYDFPVLQAATWYVVILGGADQPLSPAASVQFDPREACWYRLDWQRLD